MEWTLYCGYVSGHLGTRLPIRMTLLGRFPLLNRRIVEYRVIWAVLTPCNPPPLCYHGNRSPWNHVAIIILKAVRHNYTKKNSKVDIITQTRIIKCAGYLKVLAVQCKFSICTQDLQCPLALSSQLHGATRNILG